MWYFVNTKGMFGTKKKKHCLPVALFYGWKSQILRELEVTYFWFQRSVHNALGTEMKF